MTGMGAEKVGIRQRGWVEDVDVVSVYVQLSLKYDGGSVGGIYIRYHRKLSPALEC